jgi:hypothetical protein
LPALTLAAPQCHGFRQRRLQQELERSYPPQYVADMIAAARTVCPASAGATAVPERCLAATRSNGRPISISKTEIRSTTSSCRASDAQKTAVKGHQGFYGPAGYGSSDDIEMFGQMFEGYRSSDLKS